MDNRHRQAGMQADINTGYWSSIDNRERGLTAVICHLQSLRTRGSGFRFTDHSHPIFHTCLILTYLVHLYSRFTAALILPTQNLPETFHKSERPHVVLRGAVTRPTRAKTLKSPILLYVDNGPNHQEYVKPNAEHRPCNLKVSLNYFFSQCCLASNAEKLLVRERSRGLHTQFVHLDSFNQTLIC